MSLLDSKGNYQPNIDSSGAHYGAGYAGVAGTPVMITMKDSRGNYTPGLDSEGTHFGDGSGGAAGTGSVYEGSGSPEGVVTAKPGSIYNQIDSGVFVQQWIKQTGTGNTGWA